MCSLFKPHDGHQRTIPHQAVLHKCNAGPQTWVCLPCTEPATSTACLSQLPQWSAFATRLLGSSTTRTQHFRHLQDQTLPVLCTVLCVLPAGGKRRGLDCKLYINMLKITFLIPFLWVKTAILYDGRLSDMLYAMTGFILCKDKYFVRRNGVSTWTYTTENKNVCVHNKLSVLWPCFRECQNTWPYFKTTWSEHLYQLYDK